MRLCCVIFALVFGIVSETLAEPRWVWWLGSESDTKNFFNEPRADFYIQSTNYPVQLWAYVRANESSGGGVIGPAWSLGRWTQLNLGYGFITTKPFLTNLADQWAVQARIGSEEVKFNFLLDDNLKSSDWWYKGIFTVRTRMSKKVSVGIHSEQGLGTGLHAVGEIWLFDIWASILTDSWNFRRPLIGMVGLRLRSSDFIH